MKKVAIIGGGVSGLTMANLLKDRFVVKVFEQEATPGGLIRCQRVNGSLFHMCGGHVFNTKNPEVLNWFWSKFDREHDFIKADRRSAVCLSKGQFVDYPIENHIYQLDASIQKDVYADLEKMLANPADPVDNFGDFLLNRFGKTLYDLYFLPYNEKVWRCNLADVPLSWLEGKLPMPTPREILDANANRLEEKTFVHSTFYYERDGGSQFIADTLARNVDISYNTLIDSIVNRNGKYEIRGELFDHVVYCGNLKDLVDMLIGVDLRGFGTEIERLKYHGTTAVFCETDPIPYSWFYQPCSEHASHRFICTGNFSPSNNAPGKMTCTVEFTDGIEKDEIIRQLELMPYRPKYLTHHYSKYTYPIQGQETRRMIEALKAVLGAVNISLVGRFAEWEYYNMDAAMASAMNASQNLW